MTDSLINKLLFSARLPPSIGAFCAEKSIHRTDGQKAAWKIAVKDGT